MWSWARINSVLKQPCWLKPIYSCIHFMALRKGCFCYCEHDTRTSDITYCIFIIFWQHNFLTKYFLLEIKGREKWCYKPITNASAFFSTTLVPCMPFKCGMQFNICWGLVFVLFQRIQVGLILTSNSGGRLEKSLLPKKNQNKTVDVIYHRHKMESYPYASKN